MRTPSEEFWEDRYATTDHAWGTRPNVVLVEVIESLGIAPGGAAGGGGAALDLACGHGGDALWLASLGWHVTAVDVSATALSRLADSARAAGLGDRIRTERHDFTQTLPTGSYGLVTSSYFHGAPQLAIGREEILSRAADALVAPGGWFVLIEHGSRAPWMTSGGYDRPTPTPAETFAALQLGADWEAVRVAGPQREAHGPDGAVATVIDNVIAVRRAGRRPAAR